MYHEILKYDAYLPPINIFLLIFAFSRVVNKENSQPKTYKLKKNAYNVCNLHMQQVKPTNAIGH
jgi:hypothetical protein